MAPWNLWGRMSPLPLDDDVIGPIAVSCPMGGCHPRLLLVCGQVGSTIPTKAAALHTIGDKLRKEVKKCLLLKASFCSADTISIEHFILVITKTLPPEVVRFVFMMHVWCGLLVGVGVGRRRVHGSGLHSFSAA